VNHIGRLRIQRTSEETDIAATVVHSGEPDCRTFALEPAARPVEQPLVGHVVERPVVFVVEVSVEPVEPVVARLVEPALPRRVACRTE
jgi:hypothetical protein